jgi:hypothetical protein
MFHILSLFVYIYFYVNYFCLPMFLVNEVSYSSSHHTQNDRLVYFELGLYTDTETNS